MQNSNFNLYLIQFWSKFHTTVQLHGCIVYLKFHHMPLSFSVYMYAFFNLMLCCGKRGFLVKSHFFLNLYLIQFLSKSHETSWLYCLLKVSLCPCCFFFLIYVSSNLMLCHRIRGFCVNFHFLLISHSVLICPKGHIVLYPRSSVCLAVRPSVSNFLCPQLLLQFPSEFFETCHNESP